MRGEHPFHHVLPTVYKGSSPHARGARPSADPRLPRRGIIPACAGSTARCRCGAMARRDHPRMRGEHLWSVPAPWGSAGSSPHARGARDAAKFREQLAGIIPACAGSTTCAASPWWCRRDHPRMRGEHRATVAAPCLAKGSSPHARGALQPDGSGRCARGIIPACAGSTLLERVGRGAVRDHPRMRGEHNFSVPRRGC